jgi:ABC-2 type transport system ATP-binding protein
MMKEIIISKRTFALIMSIIVNRISKLYGLQKALQEVTFSVEPGTVTGFLGPNGAGKSTMMKILTCYLPPNSGNASVCGYDVEEQSIEVKKLVGYLPEHNPLYPDMYIKEFLSFSAGLHGIKNPGKRIAEMIEITGLGKEQQKKIGALSKGYRQRVGLAQAILHNPKVLILDEPTTGLDPNQLSEIRQLIMELGKEKTVLLSTHIMQEVKAICGRVIIVNQGQIVSDSSTEMLEKQGKMEAILVEFDRKIDTKAIKSIKGVELAEPIGENTWRLSGKDLHQIRTGILPFAVENGLSVLTLKQEEKGLEDIFRQLTGN